MSYLIILKLFLGVSVETLQLDEKRCSKCKEVKSRGEFHPSKIHRFGIYPSCRNCNTKMQFLSRVEKASVKDPNGIQCPICGFYFGRLLSHTIPAHNIYKENLILMGITKFNSDLTLLTMGKGQRIPKPNCRKGDFAEITERSITFPDKYWPADCQFVKVVVKKTEFQILFNPSINKLLSTKKVRLPDYKSHRIRVTIHLGLLRQLEISRPILALRNGAGFAIQFYQQDGELLEPFTYWAKHGQSMKNTAGLTTYSHALTPNISIGDHLWPQNAEYAYYDLFKTSRGIRYYDVLPVSRTGHIVNPKSGELLQYIGLFECREVRLMGNRICIPAGRFIHENNIPSGDWDLKEVLPSGALRFRLYRERQPKPSEDIAS
ncbi:MAG: hypothetical protein H0X33_13115 [Taibaiella sp.]|nr:hypothetical protein [Taibaiella sp.]